MDLWYSTAKYRERIGLDYELAAKSRERFHQLAGKFVLQVAWTGNFMWMSWAVKIMAYDVKLDIPNALDGTNKRNKMSWVYCTFLGECIPVSQTELFLNSTVQSKSIGFVSYLGCVRQYSAVLNVIRPIELWCPSSWACESTMSHKPKLQNLSTPTINLHKIPPNTSAKSTIFIIRRNYKVSDTLERFQTDIAV